MMKMGRNRKTKVELSDHTESYILLRKNGMSYPKLSEEAAKRGDSISPMSFHRFFTKKYNIDLEEELKERYMMVEHDGAILQKNKEKVVVIDEIHRNLTTLQQLTAGLITSGPLDSRTVNACTNLLKESRQTLEYLDKKKKETMIEQEESQEMGIATLLSLLGELPTHCPKCGEPLGLMEKINKKLEKE